MFAFIRFVIQQSGLVPAHAVGDVGSDVGVKFSISIADVNMLHRGIPKKGSKS